ncbi:ABC-type glutathione transport system ATPase component [Microbacterium sp. AK009]|uniref:ATP-binding cassette domain-containing protein n=1 Tax=Microbacterium sp. AK009 TaxID=2723068 RepID=UPI0015C86819|nr:ATP-binding cassette domain-containing protein [Microbacterium sp. AK009]NYF16634.1 ABC-type glutathione transport system ATPase component [Microbacterium sp. AK009]
MTVNAHVLSVRGLTKTFRPRGLRLPGRPRPYGLRAVDDVSFDLSAGEIVGIAGESGSGKSTTVKCVARLIDADAGEVWLDGRDLMSMKGSQLRAARRLLQVVFQDPYSSLNPRMQVGDAIREAGTTHGVPDARAPGFVAELLDKVRLPASYAKRMPRDLSGGQRQRVAIARALAPRPKLVIADEAVSALDVSVQTEIVNLFLDLRDETGISVIFVSHQLPVLTTLADRLIVMKNGRMVETGDTRAVLADPQHEYTRALLTAYPDPHASLVRRGFAPALPGEEGAIDD